jgi:hypothetical protein
LLQAEEVPELQRGQLLDLVYRLLTTEHEAVMQVGIYLSNWLGGSSRRGLGMACNSRSENA